MLGGGFGDPEPGRLPEWDEGGSLGGIGLPSQEDSGLASSAAPFTPGADFPPESDPSGGVAELTDGPARPRRPRDELRPPPSAPYAADGAREACGDT